jgi:hypothetical protein
MNSRKLFRTFLILIIAGAAVSGFADAASQKYAQTSLNRALVTYTAARTLNGVVSVAQGTEVALEPGGVGVVLTPGQVLDPINDLIERFSSVMLVAASSLGLQIILLKVTSAWGVTALLIIALAVWFASIWSPKLQDSRLMAAILKIALLLTFVRFAVPMVVICTNFMFSTFLLTEHDTAAAALEGATAKIEEINVQYETPNGETEPLQTDGEEVAEDTSNYIKNLIASVEASLPSFKEYVSRIGDSTKELASSVADWFDSMSVGDRMTLLKQSAAEATNHIVNLIVIFVLQTIIFPLGFLWIFIETLKTGATRTISAIGSQDRN